jgi:hypothetical protein
VRTELIEAKALEELSGWVLNWMNSRIKKIREQAWSQRYNLESSINQLVSLRRNIDQQRVEELWANLISRYISIESRIGASKTNQIINQLKKIGNEFTNIEDLHHAVSDFTGRHNIKVSENVMGMKNAISEYYKLLEKEMTKEQISTSYGKELIDILESQLIQLKKQEINPMITEPNNAFEFICYYNTLRYQLMFQLLIYVKELIGFSDGIISKQIRDDMLIIPNRENPFKKAEELIDRVHKKELREVRRDYSDKSEQNKVTFGSMLSEHLEELFGPQGKEKNKVKEKGTGKGKVSDKPLSPDIVISLSEHKLKNISPQSMDYEREILNSNKEKFLMYKNQGGGDQNG